MSSPEFSDEAFWLARLAESRASDPATIALLDGFTDLAAELTHCPLAWLSFASADHELVCSAHGPIRRSIDLKESALRMIIDAQGPISLDYPKCKLPLDEATLVAFCAGAPMFSGDGHSIGGIFVACDHPHTLSSAQQEGLATLANTASRLLELNRALLEARAELERRASEREHLASQVGKLEDKANEQEVQNERLQTLAETDSKTGLRNYGALSAHLDRRFSTSEPFSFLMIDIDWFKNFNEAFLHDAGDEALKTVARLLAEDGIFVARFGGEEFAIVFDAPNLSEALECGEVLRKRIERYPWPKRKITVSIGVALRTPDIQSVEDLVRRADAALFTAKRTGKNRVLAWSHG